MKLDKRLSALAWERRGLLAISVLAGLMAGVATIEQAWVLSRIVSGIFLDGKELNEMSFLLLLFAGGGVVRAGCIWGSRTAGARLAGKIERDLRKRLCLHLERLGPAFAGGHSGERISLLGEGIEKLDAYFSRYLPQLCLAVLIPAGVLAVVFPVDPLTGSILFLTAPLIPLFLILIGWRAGAASARQWRLLSRLSAHFLDLLQGMKTLKVLGRSREQIQRLEEEGRQYRIATMSVLKIAFLSSLALELVATLSTALVAVEIGLRLLYGRIPFSQALFVLILTPEFYLPLRQLGAHFHSGMEGIEAADGIFRILETPLPHRGKKRPDDSIQDVVFDQVGLTYAGRTALEGVSFSIGRGQTVAVIGPSGSGKSSIVRLLLGFVEPSSGRVLVNGRPLESYEPEEWREQISWVPDRPHLFQGSIADNLRLARPGADSKEVIEAARKAFLHEFVESLPDGYDTQIGEGGARLSRGQAQRLALARAFLKDAPLLLLDEPTAHLDPETASRIAVSLRALGRRRTVVWITHRLDEAQRADQIIIMERGTVRESGTPEALLAREGSYREMLSVYRQRTTL